MELDDLKQAWQSLDRRLAEQQALTVLVLRDQRQDRARRALRPLRWGQRLQIVAGAILMLLAGSFWTDHLDNIRFVAYGLLLHAYGLMMVVTAARNLWLQAQLDPALPVMELQQRLTALRLWRLREAVLYGVTGCFVWIPLMLVLFAAVGADVWVTVPSLVAGFVASGIVCLGIFYGLISWSGRPGQDRLRRMLWNSSIGRGVLETQALLDEIARFERA